MQVPLADVTRWMHASVATYMRAVCATINVPSLAEGLEERTTAFDESPDRIEIRFNGPYTRRYSGYTEARVSVNILATSNFGTGNKNAFSLDNALGQIHAALDAGIPLFQTGAASDTQLQIGCMQAIGEIKVFLFGQLDPLVRTRQGIVSAGFLFTFDDT